MQPEPNQPSYDFIFNSSSKSQKKGGLNLPTSGPVFFIAITLVLIVVLIIIGTAMGNKKSKVVGLPEVYGKAQEIVRVSTLEQPLMKDPNAIALLATSKSTLTSDQSQLKDYMGKHKIKLDPKKLTVYENTSTDSSLATAAQNNNLDGAYTDYLRSALTDYSSSIKTAYASSSDPSAKLVLKSAYDSAQTLLDSNALKSSPQATN